MGEKPKFVKVYYDAEFTGLHRDTSLISIGLVSDSGHYFYAEFNDYQRDQVDEWLSQHVIDNLVFNDKRKICIEYPDPIDDYKGFDCKMKDSKSEIKENLLQWLKAESDHAGGVKVQFYTDCYAYDWVLLNDLICNDGKALNLPDYLYYIPVDLSTALQINAEDPDVNREMFLGSRECNILANNFPFKNNNKTIDEVKHNSLWDAFVCKRCFEVLEECY